MNALQMSSEVVPLASRLVSIGRAEARLANAAYGAAVPAEAQAAVGFAPARAFTTVGIRMQLDADGAQLELSIAAGNLPPMLEGALAAGLPHDLLLAVTQAECAEPLGLLAQAIGGPLTLRSVSPRAAPGTEPRRAPPLHAPIFGWWRCGSLSRSPAAFSLRCTDGSSMAALAVALERMQAPPPRDAVEALPVELGLVAEAGCARAAALARLVPGEAVMLVSEGRMPRPGLLVTLRTAPGRRSAHPLILARGRVRGRYFELEKVHPMNEQTNPFRPDAELTGEDAGAIEVEVRCELTRLSMSLADISRLGPGMVVDLETPLEGMRGTLRAGGRVVGRGEIVVLGDGIALRLTDLPAASR